MRKPLRIIFLVSLFGFFFLPGSTLAVSWAAEQIGCSALGKGQMRRVYFYCPSGVEEKLLSFRKAIEERGAVHVNCFLPSYLACELPEGLDVDGIPERFGVFPVDELQGGGDGDRGELLTLRRVKRCYEVARQVAAGLPIQSRDLEDIRDTVLVVPAEKVRESRRSPGGGAGFSNGRNIQQNSEFMVGDVLAQIILPESDGNDENWKDESLSEAVVGAISALLSFQDRFSYIPMNFVFETIRRVETAYEPIHSNMETDYLWIMDVMKNLGYGEFRFAFLAVHAFNNDGRKRYDTDWVFTSFIANSENTPNHRFVGADYLAYAYLGGPFLVLPYPAGTNPYNIDQVLLFSQVFQHEASHIFWALDEYEAAPGDCYDRSGYLNIDNRNKITSTDFFGNPVGCQELVPCIMASASKDLGRPVCRYTAGQIGVSDQNQDGVPDVFNAPPTVEFEGADAETVMSGDISVNLKAISIPVPNKNPYQDPAERINYAPPLKDAICSLNGGERFSIYPLDGKWDELEEDITISFSSLPPGLIVVEVKVRNTMGVSSPFFKKKVYNMGLKYALFDLKMRNEGIGISWEVVGETFGARFDLHRIETGVIPEDTIIAYDLQPSGKRNGQFLPYSYFDQRVKPGQEYKYYVSGTFSLLIEGEERVFVSNSPVFQVTAMIPISKGSIISNASPNPFRDATTLSLNVPPTYEKSGGDLAPSGKESKLGWASSSSTELPTDVSVNVYDALGRLVKRIFSGGIYSRVITFRWDGTNSHNQRVPSGVYFLKARAGSFTEVKKVVVLR